jgi:tetratricopeptide (TPR) repeat protein
MPRTFFALLISLAMLGLATLGGCKRAAEPPAPAATRQSSATEGHEAHGMPPAPSSVAAWASGAMLFDGLGDFHRKITTSSDVAQRYFDQGMRLLWAFNHDEATRSFAKAAQLDPECAICDWGVALTVGPNYNLPFLAQERAKVAFEALGLAKSHAAQGSPVDQALIGALEKRYPNAQPLDPVTAAPVLSAYASAMKEVAARFPNDLDVQTLYAEALMNTNAWKLWTADGKPAPGTQEILATLESVLQRDPTHPGANHYYIHAVEASPQPQKGLPSAGRLYDMMPAAGHLVHMPAHILQRVGEYEAAAEANRRGVAADLAYFSKTRAPDYYGMYIGHNYQFLAFSAAMEGRRAETLDALRNTRHVMPEEILLAMPGFDWATAQDYAATVRFGLWDEMLARPAPNPKLPAMTGAYLYAKGVALASRGRLAEAKAVLQQLEQLSAEIPQNALSGLNSTRDLLGVAIDVVRARIASAEHRPEDAIASLRDAVQREDRLAYNEPSDWFFPVRHLLGAELLRDGKPQEAEGVYRDDLRRHPNNGWSLYGLSLALQAQHRSAAAQTVKREFEAAWKNADTTLTASAF